MATKLKWFTCFCSLLLCSFLVADWMMREDISSSAKGISRTINALLDFVSVAEAARLIINPVITKPTPPQETSMAWSNQVMRCSPFIKTKALAKQPVWMIEKENPHEVTFVLGDAKAKGLERFYTLKGDKKNGRLYRLERNTSGDELWHPLDW